MVDHPGGAYLDHASAGPIDPRVRQAMRPYLETRFANPESLHDWAREPAAALEVARAQVAALIGGRPEGIIFTSGDTEARNLAIKGLWSANRHTGTHIVTTPLDHAAVIACARSLERQGATLRLCPVTPEGRPALDALRAVLSPDTILVSLCHGQPEVGSLSDVAALCEAIREVAPAALIHVDAATTAGLVPIDVTAWGCDALTLGGGSLLGPRWSGALWVREGVRLHPLIEGGIHEHGKRAGAHDMPGIVGLGAAAVLARDELAVRADTMAAGVRRLLAGLLQTPDVRLNGPVEGRVPGHVSVGVEGVEGEALTLMMATRGVACSPGSACTSIGKSSSVLEAMGQRAPWTHSAVLFTLAPTTTNQEIDRAIVAFGDAVAHLRSMRPTA